jgi:hypothetical protein
MPSVDDLVRIGLDHAPSLAAEGVDRVLGPYALEASWDLRREAVALAAFLIPEDDDTTPIDRVLRDLRGGPAQGIRAARWAPLAPFTVEAPDQKTTLVSPLLPMGTGAPDTPVAWRPLPGVVPEATGHTVFARIGLTHSGWCVIAGFAVPPVMADTLAALYLTLPMGRPPSTEGTLRTAGTNLARRHLEQLWANTTTRTPTR